MSPEDLVDKKTKKELKASSIVITNPFINFKFAKDTPKKEVRVLEQPTQNIVDH